MTNPPWEPYPEKKRRLEERARRPRNKRKKSGGGVAAECGRRAIKYRKSNNNPATDSSFSSFSSSSSRSGGVRTVVSGLDASSAVNSNRDSAGHHIHRHHHHGHHVHHARSGDHVHARVRPENCWCLQDRGCGDEDSCCMEDVPGATECPCLRFNASSVVERKPDVGSCEVCMENGKLRNCCNRHYCKLCYEGTGNCPGCHRITVGANRGLLGEATATQVGGRGNNNKDSIIGGGSLGYVQDGEECRSCLRQGFHRKCCGEFYCSDCYFRSGHCPSCQQLAEKRIRYQRIPRDPGLVPVLIGYLATLLVSLAVLACVALVVASNESLQKTVFGQTCYGFFPTCITEPKCVSFDGGGIGDGLEPITEWSSCDDESTVNKIYGSYCIFDKQVDISL